MCLAIPAKVVEIINDDTILVDFGGVKREVKSTLLEDKIKLDDYVLVHIGFAMAIVDEEDALETLRLLAEIDAFNQNIEGFSESSEG
ncbi:MAG: HypC/HybG/HupF family hydrogenase formation chaperone [Asgard group archaeon]|nr:HypC/HybG/HupF family hydrogenase formation chaperone [Candidatus Heimdallarchaeota archaeon]MCK5157700.1 HypC/HybG/HupF family hydrogenase formation chaperone [Candidatus Heimdallarchaeota archaeon]MCK5183196.1 HypC/HybG/HupF family hydrogenase formation chaperone [Candidatus Heimdallarchaeota archaeon]NPE09754.1 HypC/HybG/HupF family hydrogenase formation chaperone [Asgard group archaeon]